MLLTLKRAGMWWIPGDAPGASAGHGYSSSEGKCHEQLAEVEVAVNGKVAGASILETGLKMNPPPEPTGKRGRPKRGKAGSLVDRLREQQGATLALMEDLMAPFENNQAERDIQMIKVRQKISGCFRTKAGTHRF